MADISSSYSSMAGVDAYLSPSNLTTKSAIVGKGAEELTMNDFFNLLVAQMTNQDIFNPQSDTEYIAQMAQFTTLQGIQTIQEYQLSSYASSYVGKHVTIAHTSETTGSLTRTSGVVSSVSFYDGEPKVVVDGISYPLYSVMEINSSASTSGGGVITADQAALIGKTVTIAYTEKDENDNEEDIEDKGVVTSVNAKDGRVYVMLDDNEDKEYLIDYITSIK